MGQSRSCCRLMLPSSRATPTACAIPRRATALAIGLQLPEHNVHVRTNSFLRRTTSAAGVTATAMKPAPFVYHAPASLGAALLLKAEHGDEAKFLAGGQSLIPAMNFRIAGPALLVDVNKLAALCNQPWQACRPHKDGGAGAHLRMAGRLSWPAPMTQAEFPAQGCSSHASLPALRPPLPQRMPIISR